MPDTSPSPWGTRRRLRALLARGWGAESIEEASGIPAADTMRAVPSSSWHVRSGLAERVIGAYEDLWDREPPDEDRERVTPRAAGWPPPMAWDDDVIDLPEGKPAEGWKRTGRTTSRSADLVEDMDFVCQRGGYQAESRAAVAMRLGVTRHCLDKALERTGRTARRELGEAGLEAG